MGRLSAYEPEAVILWCPTCHCRFETTIAPLVELPFQVLSYGQFVAARANRLPFGKPLEQTVTLHEPCKAAYTGVDLNGARDLLRAVPGLELVEMPRHGEQTVCCGSGAADCFPETCKVVKRDRLAEAAATGAGVLADVCHYCHWLWAGVEPGYPFEIASYVSLVAPALGIEREDTYKKYRLWGDTDRILEHAEPCVAQSPFSRDRIRQVVEATFGRRPSTWAAGR